MSNNNNEKEQFDKGFNTNPVYVDENLDINNIREDEQDSIDKNNNIELVSERQNTGSNDGDDEGDNNSNATISNKQVYNQDTEQSPQFSTPQEEIEYLRAQIAEKQKAVENMPRKIDVVEHYNSAVKEHKEKPIDNFTKEKKEFFASIENTLKDIGSKDSDKQIIALSEVMFDKGIRYVLEVIERLNNSELEDDFHRFLIKYLLSNHNFKEKDFSKSE
ncbi:MAG: hypothetical protein QM532_02760 [Cyanobium sp. MAG06]|nr:hypothetical protein [Cyanobium sp. MAG06]